MRDEVRQREIIHLDMDAFYAGVEILDDPSLRGKPVIVGGHRDRGVVSAASYEARNFGVHSAQPMATAMRLCPQGIFLPVRMSRYQEVSNRIFEIFYRFTPLVEPVSIDEAFLDVTGSAHLFGTAEEIARKIKRSVVEEVGLTVSAGVAPSKFVAKIASDMNKPDGLTVVARDKVKEFLDPLPIEKLWGVGKATQHALLGLGVRTIGDLSHLPIKMLERRFGKVGIQLHLLSQGIDQRNVEPVRIAKSIGREKTFAEDLLDFELVKREVLSLATQVARRVRRHGFAGRTITLKVKYSDFVQITRSVTLSYVTDDAKEIFENCCSLLQKTVVGRRPVRLLGISMSQLVNVEEEKQISLFEEAAAFQKKKRLNRALDAIHERFGDRSILPSELLRNKKP